MSATQLPGARLKAERENQQLDEQAVAEGLHLSLTYLRAMEADDYGRLPEPAYVKGYMRNYARLLGLPQDEIVAAFVAQCEALKAADRPPVEALRPHSGHRIAVLIIVLVAIVVVALGAWWSARAADTGAASDATMEGTVQSSAPSAVAANKPAASTPAVAASTATSGTAQIGWDKTQNASVASAPAASPVPTASAPAAAAPQVTPAATAATSGGASLVVQFSGASWVRVIDATGKVLFKGTQQAGASLARNGKPPFKLDFGDASAVSDVSVDGASVSVPQGQVVHMQVP